MRNTVLAGVLGVAAVGLIGARFVGPVALLFLAGALIVGMIVLLAGGGDATAVRRDDPLRFVDVKPAPERPRTQRAQPKPAPAPSGRALWDRAAGRHDTVLGEYAAYELDPEMLLRFPAMWDFSSPKVIAFHDALEHAGALRTDEYPGDESAAEYADAVTDLRTSWYAADRYARSTGSDGLADEDVRDLDRGLKLYRHASSSVAAERAAYLNQVVSTVDKLVDRGVLPAPPRFRAELEAEARKAIEG
ncbi:hypothetical protein [Tsukamurella ocularis]|uniref:hypothetical protein n=1 Tax=Tsukamurella ocularis TaxID=1970234 RepID=UPI0021689EA9|nr:hypothetical protein [Tsukamurella ocularis]MCS3778515.1 hypothetical protein [Tsukamurella ocularis]MCS3789216.1 hypothetical protein [Tsukamurella ocularis]MCS3853066.1 hypothetical protein [Tsukamurella ocularis]